MKKGFAVGDPRAVEQGRKGGQARGEQRKRESIARWLRLFPGTSAEAARAIYEKGYQSGHQAGMKAQRREKREP